MKAVKNSFLVEQKSKNIIENFIFIEYEDGTYSLLTSDSKKLLIGIPIENPDNINVSDKYVIEDRIENHDAYLKLIKYEEALQEYRKQLKQKFVGKCDEYKFRPYELTSLHYCFDKKEAKKQKRFDKKYINKVWKTYKTVLKAFIKECKRLHISYEKDDQKIFIELLKKAFHNDHDVNINKMINAELINQELEERIKDCNSEYDLKMLSLKYQNLSMNLGFETGDFHSMDYYYFNALWDESFPNREKLIKDYLEFLIVYPYTCYIHKNLTTCKEKVELNQTKIKLQKFQQNEQFINDIGELINHDQSYQLNYHATESKYSSEDILKNGLYMYSDSISTTSYPELSVQDILLYQYGSSFNYYEDYIIVFASFDEKNVIEEVPEEEKEQLKIMPRRIGEMGQKPNYKIPSKYILGYIDKEHMIVVKNPNYIFNEEKNNQRK